MSNDARAMPPAPPPLGVVYDLDGVLTMTADLHARAWKTLFDAYFKTRSILGESVPEPFRITVDYPLYVDGKPRLDGIRDFLASRGITLPLGTAADPPGTTTVVGLGALKNAHYQALLASEGITTDPHAETLLRQMRAAGRRQAVATSSASGRMILARTGLGAYLDAVVDGTDIAALGLKGKPAPDMFWEAARRMGALPSELDLVEDAIAGVQAGRAGGFACVVGVARNDNAAALHEAGADIVVADLNELERMWLPHTRRHEEVQRQERSRHADT